MNYSVISKSLFNNLDEDEITEQMVYANFAHTTQHKATKGRIQSVGVLLVKRDKRAWREMLDVLQ